MLERLAWRARTNMCGYWWCVNVCVSTGGWERRKRWSTFRIPPSFSYLVQKSSIFLILTATNLWLHYYSQCFILILKPEPAGGLFNGEGDGEGDPLMPLLCDLLDFSFWWKLWHFLSFYSAGFFAFIYVWQISDFILLKHTTSNHLLCSHHQSGLGVIEVKKIISPSQWLKPLHQPTEQNTSNNLLE